MLVAATISGKILKDSSPCFIALEINSGKSSAESVVLKNFSILSHAGPFTFMSNLFNCLSYASNPASGVYF